MNKPWANHTHLDAKRGPFIKTQSKTNKYNGKYFGDGRIYVLHNTLLQRPGEVYGVSSGISDLRGKMTGVVSRNNILHVTRDYRASIKNSRSRPSNDFDYDLYNGRVIGAADSQRNGIFGVPDYDGGNGSGEFALKPGSAGHDAGLRLPNFNDSFTGEGPDMGAFESGSPPLRFGVDGFGADERF